MYRFRLPTNIRQIDKIAEELCEKRDANPAREGVIRPQKRENSAKAGWLASLFKLSKQDGTKIDR